METESEEDREFGPNGYSQQKQTFSLGSTNLLQSGGNASRISTFAHTRSLILLAALSTGTFTLTVWYADAAFSAELTIHAAKAVNKLFRIEFGSAIAILRILQGLLATLTTASLYNAFEIVQWAHISDQDGAECLRVLGISPSTGVIGTLGLLVDRQARMVDRGWSSLRFIMVIFTWLAGILLFLKTSLTTRYESIHTYETTAGVGFFNGSYVHSFLDDLGSTQPGYAHTIVPFNLMGTAYSLVGNSMHTSIVDPIDDLCRSAERPCDSYLFTGGLLMTTPWAPIGYDTHPLINIYNFPATQIEFRRGMSNQYSFSNSDCDTYGTAGVLVGVRFCISENPHINGSYFAGIYLCLNGTDGGECNSINPTPNLTTTFSVFSRTASIVTSRQNYTILSILDTGEPTLNRGIDLSAYRASMGWLLDFNASGIPAPSSIAGVFWSSPDQLSSDYWSSELYHSFQSLLAFPFWQFNPNNFGNTHLNAKEIASDLPPEFYTTASITKPYTRIIINKFMFIAFLLLESFILAFIWMVPVWLWLYPRKMPKRSSYPLIDFAFKSSISRLSEGDMSKRLMEASDRETRSVLKDVFVTRCKDD